jgi:hypothetical protein
MLQCVVVCCSELAVAMCWKSLKTKFAGALRCIAVCRRVLQSLKTLDMLQCVTVFCKSFMTMSFRDFKCVAVCCMSLQTKSWLETSEALV